MSSESAAKYYLQPECETVMEEIFDRCIQIAPNFGVRLECFKESLNKTLSKYLLSNAENPPTTKEIIELLNSIQANDLFMALACAAGNERAWWEFDQQHRAYLERVSRHLASSEIDAEEVVDSVYVELYGTKVVDGMRQSKFASYSGRGSLRGWLRTVVWHSLVDLHRGSHDEVSLDEMMETVGEGHAQSTFIVQGKGGEDEMVESISRQRYRKQALTAIESAFSNLDDHEKLLLLYYHVENLKLREISRLVALPDSPLRSWFQRKNEQREKAADARIHESTIMRWLDKTYAKILKFFRNELTTGESKLREPEVELCMQIVTEDLANGDVFRNLLPTKTA